jgi:type II secretion system protein H
MVLTVRKAAKVTTQTFTTIRGGSCRRGRGFTLVEIMIVIILIGLMAGVGTAFSIGTYQSLLVKKSARDFLVAAKFARITAIEQGQSCRIDINRNENAFAITVEQADSQTGETAATVIRNVFFKPVKMTGDVRFEDIQIDGVSMMTDESEAAASIVFYPDGTSQGCIVQIGDGKDHFTATINPANGRARLTRGTSETAETGVVDMDLIQ